MVLNTGYTHFHGPEVNTRAIVSQKVRLFSFIPNQGEASDSAQESAPRNQIGVMTSFNVSEDRAIEPIRGIGFGDRIAELVPGVTSPVQISASRVALWLSNIMQVFGYNAGVDGIVRSLRHHRWPFDIRQEMIFSEIVQPPTILDAVSDFTQIGASQNNLGPGTDPTFDDTRSLLVTFYEGCWMSSYSVAFDANQAIVTENCNISASDVTSGPQGGKIEEYFAENSNENKATRVATS